MNDRKAVQCNFSVATAEARVGSRAYVLDYKPTRKRVQLLLKSKGGRWVVKWENRKRLENFRAKTIPPQHPVYEKLSEYWSERAEEFAAHLNSEGAK